MQLVRFQDWGLIDYQQAWDDQAKLQRELIEIKTTNRQLKLDGLPLLDNRHYLVFCEHYPVYTLGKSGSMDHLLVDEVSLQKNGYKFFKINRGGDITFHGPGQLVGYPIFDLDEFFTDIHKYVRYLEEAVIRTLAEYDLEGIRVKEYTGVWLEAHYNLPRRKICAIGVHLSRWVTMHGFAFNVNTNLDHFKNIIPCGIQQADTDVTSLALELGHEIPMEEVKATMRKHFAAIFGFEFSK